MSPISISRFDRARDLEGLLALEAASFTNPTTREMFVWEIDHSDVSRIWVAHDTAGALVATCSCWLVFDELHVHTVAVRQEWRRQGVARALMVAVFRDAAGEGAARATLEVRRSNDPARRLYEGLGFEVRGTRPAYYTRPVEDALILWREDIGSI